MIEMVKQNSASIKSSDPLTEIKVFPKLNLPIVEPPPMHKAFQNWVVFSDLHVKDSSIDICEEILYKVNEEAQKNNAGIIFLGDFWHVRGSLSVDLLNRVLKVLRTWTQPVIMIPGNHDQVRPTFNIATVPCLIENRPRR
jgi:metallophosphoesterase superfamily enzyme